jgi:hypothetical protein
MKCEHVPALHVALGGCPSDGLDFGNPSPPLMGKYEGDGRSLVSFLSRSCVVKEEKAHRKRAHSPCLR